MKMTNDEEEKDAVNPLDISEVRVLMVCVKYVLSVSAGLSGD